MTIAGIPNRGSMYAGPGGILMFGNPKQNHPDDTAKLTRGLGGSSGGGNEMHFAIRETFHPRTAQLGFVRAGYLAAFAALGYTYCFRPALTAIRSVLNGDDDGNLVLPVFRLGNSRAADRHLGLIDEPSWLQGALLAVIGQTAVVLPTVDTPGDPFVGDRCAPREEPRRPRGAVFDLARMGVAHRARAPLRPMAHRSRRVATWIDSGPYAVVQRAARRSIDDLLHLSAALAAEGRRICRRAVA